MDKQCLRCKKVKSIKEFSNTSSGGKVYLHSRCKKCCREVRDIHWKKTGYKDTFYPKK
jgi:hypothetical protein